MDKLNRDLNIQQAQFKKLMAALPRIMGVQAVNFMRQNFDKEGLINNGGVSKWKSRTPGNPSKKKILSGRGNLKDAIKYRLVGSSSVGIGVDLAVVPYAKIHNEGGVIPVTLKMRRYFMAMFMETGDEFWFRLSRIKADHIVIPKREFMAITPDLEKNIEREINKRMDDIFK